MDTLRADAVDPTAAAPGLPGLAAWGRSATRFDGALASSSWTGPSIATLLTGLSPWNHGLLEVAAGTRLAAGVPNLASRLRRAGWSTAAITGGGWVGAGSGLTHGFETSAEDFDAIAPAAAIARWQAARPKDRPFLLFVHTYAAHDPYGDKSRPETGACDAAHDDEIERLAAALDRAGPDALRALAPAYLAARLADPCARDALVRRLGADRVDALLGWFTPWLDGGWRDAPGGPELVAQLRGAYARGLETVDRRLSALLDALAALPPETVIVVCSDHGEAFGEHGALYHGRYLHPELVRTVLYVRAAGLPKGAAIAGSCGLVDVVPTLLDLAGLPADPTLDGVSLASLARDGGAGHPIASIVAVPAGSATAPDLRRVAVRDAGLAWTATFDLRTGAWGDEAWFDRARDPGETAPRAVDPASRSAAFDATRATLLRAVGDRYRIWTGSTATVR